ncbi:hypothetical protein [Paenibacillus paeoniae]|uniref:DUF4064 domain-containing protein n=1 Tax=Paenibacillus paeoniae TaxID=2292705 RepID=A0A371P043_9BACL|nr:hypothetical protein [Paenibacillus paeoniae]REK69297.1 hypothetical protein DX130_24345 [Paenibacillus paeoniae]
MNDNQNQQEQQQPQGQPVDQGQAFSGFSSVGNGPYGQAPIILKHSGLGITSFIMALASVITFILAIVIIAANAYDLVNGTSTEDIQQQILDGNGAGFGAVVAGGLLVILSIVISFIGLVLGIIGACMKNRKKVFSIIGIVLNALITIGSFFMFLISIMTAV